MIKIEEEFLKYMELRKKVGIELISENIDEIFKVINQNSLPYRRKMAFYNCALMDVENRFNLLKEELSMDSERNPIESIKSRIKTPESLIKKMVKKRISKIEDIDQEIHDIAGVRVVCSFLEDVYYLEKRILSQNDVKLISRKDYIKNPKKSGYQSLHLIVEVPIQLENEEKNVCVEIQIRTIAMDFWASLEHKLRYKKNLNDDILNEINDTLYKCSNSISKMDKEMQKIKTLIDTN